MPAFNDPQFWTSLLRIIWIDLLLAGDNAVVIALAVRTLPPRQQWWGRIWGTVGAVGLRLLFLFIITFLLGVPLLKGIGGAILIWIAIKLLADEDDETAVLKEADRLWHAVRTVAVADAVMSLDNVIAIAAVAQGSTVLLVIGLAISIPLIVGGAALVMAVLARLPILVWAGAALLGWIAGEMLISDPWLIRRLGEDVVHRLEIPAALVCTALVVGLGYTLSRRSAEQEI